MQQSAFTYLMAPVLGWLVTVSILVVAYLGSLTFQEWRRNREMDRERERLGLRRA